MDLPLPVGWTCAMKRFGEEMQSMIACSWYGRQDGNDDGSPISGGGGNVIGILIAPC